ncbi:MAG: hypothetical protein ABR915_09490 [Thermoguttaceae bacterium]|jgi:hypothetical protein
MSVAESQPAAPQPKPRWYHLTPDRLILALLALVCLLWLSERLGWLPWHKGWTVLAAVASVGVALLFFFLWLVAALVFRLRFQFSIRSLLVLTVAVAIPCSWLAMEIKKAKEQKATVEGMAVGYDWETDAYGSLLPNAQPPEPQLLRELLGNDFFDQVAAASIRDDAQMERVKGLSRLCNVMGETQVTDAGLKHLEGLSQLRVLNLVNSKITDGGLQHLERLSQLKWLHLSGPAITAVGLQHLEGLCRLEELGIHDTKVTNEWLRHLERLHQLRSVYLNRTAITDAGLRHLERLPQLQELWLNGTNVTDEGVKELQQALPNCKIER